MGEYEAKAKACAKFLRERVGSVGYAHAFSAGWESAKADTLAAEHTADLKRQNEFYRDNERDDIGRDE